MRLARLGLGAEPYFSARFRSSPSWRPARSWQEQSHPHHRSRGGCNAAILLAFACSRIARGLLTEAVIKKLRFGQGLRRAERRWNAWPLVGVAGRADTPPMSGTTTRLDNLSAFSMKEPCCGWSGGYTALNIQPRAVVRLGSIHPARSGLCFLAFSLSTPGPTGPQRLSLRRLSSSSQ